MIWKMKVVIDREGKDASDGDAKNFAGHGLCS
jgi:hypothetical protein